jgi:hypothetical protein
MPTKHESKTVGALSGGNVTYGLGRSLAVEIDIPP